MILYRYNSIYTLYCYRRSPLQQGAAAECCICILPNSVYEGDFFIKFRTPKRRGYGATSYDTPRRGREGNRASVYIYIYMYSSRDGHTHLANASMDSPWLLSSCASGRGRAGCDRPAGFMMACAAAGWWWWWLNCCMYCMCPRCVGGWLYPLASSGDFSMRGESATK